MIKKTISKAILTLAFMGCIGEGFVLNSHAVNSYLDVTVSNISGVTSQDPYSKLTIKDDDTQGFYIKLTRLDYGPSISFKAYSQYGWQCSNSLYYPAHLTGERLSHAYDVSRAYAGQKYYVYASTPQYYGGVRGVGKYCP